MSEKIKEMLEETHKRTFTIETRAGDEDSGLIEIAFSSEEPYERYFGTEVLSHEPQSVKLDRLNGGAAVLVNHDTDDQVGVVESARIDDDKRGRAVLRFSRSARGQEIKQDVDDGIRQLVSVGYRIMKYEVAERDGQNDLVTVTEWEPYEVSIVAIPADTTVGVGRSAEKAGTKTIKQKVKKMEDEENTTEATETEKPNFDAARELTKLRTDEAKRVDSIRAMGDAHNLEELAREGISAGWSSSEFNERALVEVGKRNNAARSSTSHDGEVDLSAQERQSFSLLRLLDAVANPNDRTAQRAAGFELEVSAEAQRGFGSDFKCRGEFVPESLLGGTRLLSVGTATDGAELVAENLLAGSYIDVLRNSSSVMQAGATVLPGLVGNVEIPRQTSGATSTWISAEDGDATEGEAQFDQVSMRPRDLACYTEVTRRLLQQSTPAIEGIVRTDLAFAQALGIDAAALYGTGATGQPRGVANQTGINTVTLAAAAPTYLEMVQMVASVMADNAMIGSASWMFDANGWESLMTTPKQGSGVEGNFIMGDSGTAVGYDSMMSNQVTADDFFFGVWSQILIGEWGGLEINVDPYTHSLKGKIRYITFKTCDVAVRHPEAFCYGTTV